MPRGSARQLNWPEGAIACARETIGRSHGWMHQFLVVAELSVHAALTGLLPE